MTHALLTRSARAAATLVKANTIVPERPDRLPRALWAAARFGTGMLGAVAASASRYPHVTAIATPSQELTYRQLWHGSASLTRGLAEAGIDSRSTVGILCRNSPTFALALLAAARLGADVVFLNTGLGREQLAATIESESLDLVLHDTDFAEVLGDRAGFDTATMHALSNEHGGSVPRPPRSSRLVVLTSGTTGRPKGASRGSDGQATDGAVALLGRIPMRARDTMVIPAPFFHAWGLANLLIGLGLSATVVTAPEFDARTTLDLVAAHRARTLVVVPAMLQRICTLPATELAHADTDSLAIIASSGAALPGCLSREILDRFGPVLYNVYGSTEVATATIATPTDLRAEPTTAGRPAPGTRVAILDPLGHPVRRTEIGQIFVGNQARFDGYTGGGGKEIVDGLLSTGDMGHFDEHGRLFVDGRSDDMIVSGGENVYPREVEELLAHHPDIEEAVVVGVPDEKFGQALKAVVVRRAGSSVHEQTLKDHVTERLARYKVPRSFEFVDALPRTATGKVLRRELV